MLVLIVADDSKLDVRCLASKVVVIGHSFGGAVLFGWETLRLKLGVSYYQPRDVPEGFALPIIGLWWRFDG